MMGNQESTIEGVHPEGECHHHFFGGRGGLLGVAIIIGLVGKQQIWGKTLGKMRGVIIVITRGSVIGGLVPPSTWLAIPVQKWGIIHPNVGQINGGNRAGNDTPRLSLEKWTGQVV